MFLRSSLCALVVVLLVSWTDVVSAHSNPARPLKRLAHPSTLALEILPRQAHPSSSQKRNAVSPRSTSLRHDDSFRLVISAFDDKFYLHLRPNDHLVHPSARINYFSTSPDGQTTISRTKPLLRESVKAYWGEVIPAEYSAPRMREDAAGVLPSPPRFPELGWARIVIHHQGDVDQDIAPVFEGAFSVNGVIHHITTKDNYLRNKHYLDPEIAHPLDDVDSSLVIWRDSDVMNASEEETVGRTGRPDTEASIHLPRPQTCGHDSLSYNTDPAQNPVLRTSLVSPNPWYDPIGLAFLGNKSLVARDDVAGGSTTNANFANSIGQNAGCPTTQKVLYMGVAADCEYTAQYGSHDNATKQILTDWNTASALYKSTFNVSLGIVELQIQDATCPNTTDPSIPWNVGCSSSNITLNDRLSLFSQWRGDKGDDGVGLWHLMSACTTGSEVGIAWLSTLCQQTASGQAPAVVSGTAVSTSGRTEWQVIAHEIGHNFGAIHDCADGCNSTTACCPLDTDTCDANAKFLMSPIAEAGEMNFSPCSLGNICSLMVGTSGGGKTNTSCLVDVGAGVRQTISLQMCGNGIVEQDEECDPGEDVTSPCCDSATCKFINGAVCDPDSSICCTNQCTFAPSTQVCRPSVDTQCDFAETCTGNSSSCPSDTFAPNGQSCGSNDLKCASGHCTSVASQCQAAGSSMGLTQACPNPPSGSCQISCQDPTNSNQCVVLSGLLIDGSPCGTGGVCVTGKCQSGGLLDTAKAWFTQNLQISIPVTVVAGIAVILLVWALIIAMRRCCRRDADKSGVDPVFLGQKPERLASFEQIPAGQGGPIRRSSPPLPASLQPGSNASFITTPASVYDRGGGNGIHSRSSGSREFGNTSRGSSWVDTRKYNGS